MRIEGSRAKETRDFTSIDADVAIRFWRCCKDRGLKWRDVLTGLINAWVDAVARRDVEDAYEETVKDLL